MKFISDVKNFLYTGKNISGEFEMWYFDAMDNDGDYYFTARIYSGNPNASIAAQNSDSGTVKNYCGIRFFLYYQNRLTYDAIFDYGSKSFKLIDEDELNKMSLDKNIFYYDDKQNKFHLSINYSSSEFETKFKAEFEFVPLVKKMSLTDRSVSDENPEIYWLPVSPVNRVTGKIKVYKDYKRFKTIFNGRGYIEKTWGNIPTLKNLTTSYWGKFISDEYSFVFYISELKNGDKFLKLLIYKDNLILLEKEEFNISFKKTLFTYKVKSAEIESNDLKIVMKNEINIESGEFGDKYIAKYDMYYNEKKVIKNAYGFFEMVINP